MQRFSPLGVRNIPATSYLKAREVQNYSSSGFYLQANFMALICNVCICMDKLVFDSQSVQANLWNRKRSQIHWGKIWTAWTRILVINRRRNGPDHVSHMMSEGKLSRGTESENIWLEVRYTAISRWAVFRSGFLFHANRQLTVNRRMIECPSKEIQGNW